MYDRWTIKNRTTALQLDAAIRASQIELDKLILYNDFQEQKLSECQDMFEQNREMGAELIEIVGEINLMRDKMEQGKTQVKTHYQITSPFAQNSNEKSPLVSKKNSNRRTKETSKRDGMSSMRENNHKKERPSKQA